MIAPTFDTSDERAGVPPAAVVIARDLHTRVAVCPICTECGAIVTEAELLTLSLGAGEPEFTRVRYRCGWCDNAWLEEAGTD